jgi:MoaA/NifB/PqqE/SkfB family radical SAM enzyme
MRIIRQILRPDPKVLYLEPVFGCNYRCFFCIHGSGSPSPPVHLKPSLFEKLKPLIERTTHIHFTGLGEPLLNPHLLEYLAYLREKDKSYYINTNGSMITGTHAHLLTSSRSELSISLDAGDAGTYRKMRSGGSWRKVITGLKRVYQLKTDRNSPYPLLYLSFHVNGLNLMSLLKVPQLARELPGIYSEQTVLAIIKDCLRFYKQRSRHGERLGQILRPADFNEFARRYPG